jgi:hypothetical protein
MAALDFEAVGISVVNPGTGHQPSLGRMRDTLSPLLRSAAQWSAQSVVLSALHLGPLLAETHRDFNRFRGGSHQDSDFAL